jgi:AcrR family transcriptional regulator
MRTRRPESRKQEILDTALILARMVGYQNVQLPQVAARCQCSTGTVMKYYTTMNQLKRAIMGAAIAREDLKVIAQGIIAGDPRARAVDHRIKVKAMEAVCSL